MHEKKKHERGAFFLDYDFSAADLRIPPSPFKIIVALVSKVKFVTRVKTKKISEPFFANSSDS